jgi:DMSO/TMAO reductase YedYZ molybdopterin-dependent catalytic subunit
MMAGRAAERTCPAGQVGEDSMAEPGRGVSRRRALELLAAGAMVGCDRVVLDPGPGPDVIPPITPTADFYVYQHGFRPDVDPTTWTCALVQRGSPIATLDAAFFDSLTPVELEHTLQCIGSNPRSPQIGNAVWGGLPFDELLDGLGASVDPAVVEVLFEGADGYHTSIPVADLLEGRIWLVWRMNGEALTAEHGAPCRFLVQGRYGTKNVKWPVRVELIDTPHEGYWESRGWSADATYRQNGFVFAPRDGSTVIGTVNLVGTAYAGSDPVVRVEVSFDEGDSWDGRRAGVRTGTGRLGAVALRAGGRFGQDAGEDSRDHRGRAGER